MAIEDKLISNDAAGDSVVEEDILEESDVDERRRGGWIVWLTLLVLVLAAFWLVRQYSDFGRAPDQASASATSTVGDVTVPDVTGMARAEAVDALKKAGFYVEVDVSFDAVADPNTVVSQDPPGGESVVVGSTVFLTVTQDIGLGAGAGTGEASEDATMGKMPDVVGMRRALAVEALSDAGFEVAIKGVYSDTVPRGVVVEQSAVVSASSVGNTRIPLLVSLGIAPDTSGVPSIVGLSQEEAEAVVKAAGFSPRPTYQPNPASAGRVYQQSPDPGTQAPANRLVFMLIGVDPNQ